MTSYTARKSIILSNLPKTALPADIRRLCAKFRAENIRKGACPRGFWFIVTLSPILVEIDYRRLAPTGSAHIHLSDSAFLRNSVSALQGAMLAAHEVKAAPASPDEDDPRPLRIRGAQGRLEAAERGQLGDGPGGGVTGHGSSVVLYGLPGKMSTDAVWHYLSGYKLGGSTKQGKDIVKLEQ